MILCEFKDIWGRLRRFLSIDIEESQLSLACCLCNDVTLGRTRRAMYAPNELKNMFLTIDSIKKGARAVGAKIPRAYNLKRR